VKNKIKDLFNIKYPIIQGGMVWCSGWRLASAVTNSGGLGLIGSGSMKPEVLIHHIRQCRENTNLNFGVNIPLLFPYASEHIDIVIKEKVPIVFTSAGNPSIWTEKLKKNNIKVVHVVSNLQYALKAIEAGVDAIVCEGFEAGGHNGRDETTTFCLVPLVRKHVQIPLIAAGGISSGKSMLAAMVLGADAVQIGSRFVVSKESSAHINFKNKILSLKDGDTVLTLKELTPVRMIKNDFFSKVQKAYEDKYSVHQLKLLLGKGRAKKGMFNGNLIEGELEIGQVASLLDSIDSAAEIINKIISEFNFEKSRVDNI
tara:strand:- start:14159 stop:15100 length:942 start_codon:yes stop_codon:yes gene_type:complete